MRWLCQRDSLLSGVVMPWSAFRMRTVTSGGARSRRSWDYRRASVHAVRALCIALCQGGIDTPRLIGKPLACAMEAKQGLSHLIARGVPVPLGALWLQPVIGVLLERTGRV